MKLYFNKFTRATRCRWLIEEAGIPCEIVNVDLMAGEHKRPAHLAVHPLGKLPALEDEGVNLIESAAICCYLTDRYAPSFAPAADSIARGLYHQWIFFAMCTVEPPLGRYFHASRKPEGDQDHAAMEADRRELAAANTIVARALEGKEWLVEDRLTTADIVMASMYAWADRLGLLEDQPVLKAYAARASARPAFVKSRS